MPAHEVVGIPGWGARPSWAGKAPVSQLLVSGDGERFAAVRSGELVIRDVKGATVSRATVPADGKVQAVSIDGVSAFVVVTGTELIVWSTSTTTSTTVPVPAETTVSVLGAVLVVTTPDGTVSVLTGGGLAPFVSPRSGVAPLAITGDGAMQWASARGEVLTASSVGTLVQQTPLAPPVPGATVSRWVAGGDTITVLWALPDGSTSLATHSPADGSVLAAVPVDAATVRSIWVRSPGSTVAMLGAHQVDIGTGWIGTPAADFAASSALGDSFYGAIGTAAAVLDGDQVHVAAQPPTIRPIGVLANGALLTTEQGVPAILPKSAAK
ncbi:hypothetical protein [Plantibacter sp. CFBP 8804]|uniref:hypothetical protein n=1 Tax=Plantibacter sp. CFBP 8804 TaxID=2775270 RepID=UPI001FCE3912|nr:hypothetical protein [Plantibacter sp. CFBP 8804]